MVHDPDQQPSRWRRRLRIGLTATVVVLALAAFSFVVWASLTPEPGPAAQAAISNAASGVEVVDDGDLAFVPSDPATVGLILYPGGRVDPDSYAVLALPVAEAGYTAVIPSVRLNLAVLDQNVADRVMDDHPDIDTWVVGGHSLGGAMAALYAGNNLDKVDGLALVAAYPAGSTNLVGTGISVVSVYGTNDGLTSWQEIDDSADQLPGDTSFVAIDGGNHAQFGDYGTQSGDNHATIDADEQWQQTVDALIDLLDAVAADAS